jgi:hypothetical protein
MSGFRSRRPASPAVRRYEVGGARSAAERVLYELLSHHLPRGVLREAEPLPDLDAGLQRVAPGRPLVAHAAEVPRLVGENGECAGVWLALTSPLKASR